MKRFNRILMIAALFVVSATVSANAQIYYGIKAGANISTVGASDAVKEIGDMKSEFGYQGGIVLGAEIPIIGIGIEAEGLWVNNKMAFDGDGGDIISNSIEIPVMVNVPLLPMFPLSLKAGPTFMVYNKATHTAEDGLTTDLDAVKSSVGYTVGLGLKVFKFTFDVRFNGQFKSSNPFGSLLEYTNETSSYDIRANTFSASLGYRF